jgi:peroxiredoxin 2/4
MSMMNKTAPDFEANAYADGDIKKVKLSGQRGKWIVLFFYPADYTFVCPTEIEGFADNYGKFKEKNCEVMSVSTDTADVHRAWASSDPRIRKVQYPMVSDRTGAISKSYGVYDESTGNALRGLFIINPEGVVKYETVTDDSVGRSTDETYRMLCALQSGGLCPINWHSGDPTLKKG